MLIICQFGIVFKTACWVKNSNNKMQQNSGVNYAICRERQGLNIHKHFLLVAVIFGEET